MYLALVGDRNKQVCPFNVVHQDPASGRPQLQQPTVDLEAAERKFIDELRGIAWPPEVQEAINDFVTVKAAEDAHLRAAIGASTDQQFYDALNRAFAASADAAGPAQLLRILLGLEGIPTDPC